MSPRSRASGAVAVVALTLLGAASRVAASTREVDVPSLPEDVVALVATGDGGAWLLGKGHDYPNRPELWRFDGADRPPARIDIPGGREPVAIAWSPDDRVLWLAGADFVALREPDRSFKQIPIPSCSTVGIEVIAVLAPGRAALARNGLGCPAEVTLLRNGPELSSISDRLDGDGTIDGLISDGRGGLWAVARFERTGYPDHVRGYFHRDETHWQAWMPDGRWPDRLQPAPGSAQANATAPELGQDWKANFLVADGVGGFYFLNGLGMGLVNDPFYRVSANGTANRIDRRGWPNGGNAMFWNDVAFDATSRGLLFLSGGTRSPSLNGPESTERFRILLFDGERVVREEDLPSLPSWGRHEWQRGAVAGGGGNWWAAYGGLVLSDRAGNWTLYESQRMRARIAGERHQDTMDTLSWFVPGMLGVVATSAAGGLAASRIHGQAFLPSSASVLGGALVGGLPAAAMYNAAEDYQAAFAFLTTIGGVLWGTAFGGLGTWGAGEAVARSRNRGAALGGAFAGALVGSLLADPLRGIFGRQSDTVAALAVGVCAGLIGSFAAFGYQWAGGGPR